jgi:hypothetical protein
MLAVVDVEGTRYLFLPTPPEQVQDIARRHGLTQLLLGRATDLTAYPIEALNHTPFIADDLSSLRLRARAPADLALAVVVRAARETEACCGAWSIGLRRRHIPLTRDHSKQSGD